MEIDYYKKYLKYKAKYLELQKQLGGGDSICHFGSTKLCEYRSRSDQEKYKKYGDCESSSGNQFCLFHQKCHKSKNEKECKDNFVDLLSKSTGKRCEWNPEKKECFNPDKKLFGVF